MRRPSFFDSLGHAFRGLRFVYVHEKNFRIECFFAFCVFASFFIFSFSRIETLLLILLAGSVLILEVVNTVVEHFLDLIKPRLSYQVQVVKDILAGMVFLASAVALILGLLIYVPAFFELWR